MYACVDDNFNKWLMQEYFGLFGLLFCSGTDNTGSGSSGTLSTDDMDQAIKIHEKRINNMYFI